MIIETMTIAALGAAFFVMYVALASISFNATYIMPTIVKLETIAKASNLTIDYDFYKIKNYNEKQPIVAFAIMSIIPLIGMIYISYTFELFKPIVDSIGMVLILESILMILYSTGLRKRFKNLLIDLKIKLLLDEAFETVGLFEVVDSTGKELYRNVKKFQNFQMLLLVVTMVTMILAL